MPASGAFHPGLEQRGARLPQPAPAPRVLRADTPVRPSDLYGAHKAEAEQHVRSSGLEWVILRLAGVMSVDPGAMPLSMDALFFESALPTDGRIHTVDVRDVAAAFAAATTADVIGEILLIGGDESHLLRQGDVGKALAAARGLVNVLPGGRPGDPDSEEDWYVTDWMDTARAQQALSFQRHPWPDMLAEMRAAAGWQRYPMRLVSPIARQFLKRRAAYRNSPGRYADPWGAIRAEFGEPAARTGARDAVVRSLSRRPAATAAPSIGNSTTGANSAKNSIAAAMVRSTKVAKSSKATRSRIHWELRATTPMRCGSEEPCTVAMTSRSC